MIENNTEEGFVIVTPQKVYLANLMVLASLSAQNTTDERGRLIMFSNNETDYFVTKKKLYQRSSKGLDYNTTATPLSNGTAQYKIDETFLFMLLSITLFIHQ